MGVTLNGLYMYVGDTCAYVCICVCMCVCVCAAERQRERERERERERLKSSPTSLPGIFEIAGTFAIF